MRIRNIGTNLFLFLVMGCCVGTVQAEDGVLTPKMPPVKPVQPPEVLPVSALVETAPPPTVPVAPETFSGNDVAYLEGRISSLEMELKKKQDKTDSQKGFTKTIGGMVFFDSYMNADQKGADAGAPSQLRDLKNWNGLGEVRFNIKGEGYGIFDYLIDASLVQATGSPNNNSGVNFKDVYFGVKNVPLLEYVRIGHHFVEDGLSHTVGAPNTTSFDADDRDFNLSRRIGISSRHLWKQDRLRFFAGLFYDYDFMASRRFASQDNQGSITNFRLTYMPYASRGADGKINGKQFLLLGGNYSYVDVTKTNGATPVSFIQRFGGLKIGNVFSATIDTANYHKIGLEFAAQTGPLLLQSEIFANVYDNAAVAGIRKDRTVTGGYVLARYFLTRDYRKFSAENGAWGAVELNHNLDLRKVNDSNYAEWLGAWELFSKWGYTDSSHLFELGGPDCGSVHHLTVGLNWYWSAQARWMFNYVHVTPGQIRSGLTRDHSDADIFAVAFRYNF